MTLHHPASSAERMLDAWKQFLVEKKHAKTDTHSDPVATYAEANLAAYLYVKKN